jgi:hypothetical protein
MPARSPALKFEARAFEGSPQPVVAYNVPLIRLSAIDGGNH